MTREVNEARFKCSRECEFSRLNCANESKSRISTTRCTAVQATGVNL